MNATIVRRLAVKDWHFNRWPMLGYLVAGAAALAVLGMGSDLSFYVGSILLISAVIAVGVHLIMLTVVYERKEKTLPFVMSLPVSPTEYTTAKILANVSAFLVPWLVLVTATIVMAQNSSRLPAGLIPFAVLVLGELFVAYCVMLAVALMTESEGWTIFAVVIMNLSLNLFLYSVSKVPSIEGPMTGPVAVWSREALLILGAEALAVVALLALTFWVQSRKKDFL